MCPGVGCHAGFWADRLAEMAATAARKRRHLRMLCKIQFDFVDVTPSPSFSGLDGAHDGVLGRVEMFRSVSIFGGVATADVSTLKAQPKVYPTVAHLQALFTAFGMRFDVLDLIEMRALSHFSLLWAVAVGAALGSAF